jgi:hypothetical protein
MERFPMFDLTLAMRLEIAKIVNKAADSREVLDVYLAACMVQGKHPAANVAIEDIVAAFISAAVGRSVVMELDERIALAEDLRMESGINRFDLSKVTIH